MQTKESYIQPETSELCTTSLMYARITVSQQKKSFIIEILIKQEDKSILEIHTCYVDLDLNNMEIFISTLGYAGFFPSQSSLVLPIINHELELLQYSKGGRMVFQSLLS